MSGKGFSVQPKHNCPHIAGVASAYDAVPAMPLYPNACAECRDGGENWVCLSCLRVGCSRYVLGHASAHHSATGHPIAISYADCSAWCYLCSDYIDGGFVRPFVTGVQHAKFGGGPTAAAATAAPKPEPMVVEAAAAAAAAPAEEVAKITETARNIEIAASEAKDTLVVENSKSCEISVNGSEIGKFAIVGSDHIKMACKARVVSGSFGVKNSKTVSVAMQRQIGHVFVEDCEDVTLALYGEGELPFDVVHTTRCSNVSIVLRDGRRYRIRSSRSRSIATQIVRRAIVSEYADGGAAPDDDDDDDHQGEQGVAIPPSRRKHGHANPEDIKEFFDTPEELEEKIRSLAAMMRNSKGEWEYVVVYTGAGISTSAQIPDYRGPEGAWTLADQGKSVTMKVTFEEARPTIAHMAIAELVRRGAVKFVTTTNIDALHLRSGIPPEKLAELHGDCFLEVCRKCKARWLRPFDTTSVKGEVIVEGDVHSTGRQCERCGQPLFDSIVHFGESLPTQEIKKALEESQKSSVSLVLGTSMLVHPACDLPLNAPTMVIVNLQKTQYDSAAQLRIFARTDEVMIKLMAALGIPIPDYTPTPLAGAAAPAAKH